MWQAPRLCRVDCPLFWMDVACTVACPHEMCTETTETFWENVRRKKNNFNNENWVLLLGLGVASITHTQPSPERKSVVYSTKCIALLNPAESTPLWVSVLSVH